MPDVPEMTFGHIGIDVTEVQPMVDFYTKVLGFTVTDRGTSSRGTELAFLSRNPEEHHQIVLAEGKSPENPPTVNQMSFRVKNFSDVRDVYDRVTAAGVQAVAPIDHGAALSVYFPDPEGNRFEVYWPTPWYIEQPHAKPIDFSKSDDEIIAACEEKCKADPTYQLMDEWKSKFGNW
jgi:catechol 2,3-dioxygenase